LSDIEEWVCTSTAFPAPQFDQLHSWWSCAGAATLPPSSAVISPETLKPYLGNLLLVQPIPSAELNRIRFFVRVHGVNLVQRAGYNLDGRFLDDIPNPEFRALAAKTFAAVHAAGRPLYTLRYRMVGEEVLKYASLFLPFSDGRQIDRIMVYLAYLDELGPETSDDRASA
jgi:hypothetical protein